MLQFLGMTLKKALKIQKTLKMMTLLQTVADLLGFSCSLENSVQIPVLEGAADFKLL